MGAASQAHGVLLAVRHHVRGGCGKSPHATVSDILVRGALHALEDSLLRLARNPLIVAALALASACGSPSSGTDAGTGGDSATDGGDALKKVEIAFKFAVNGQPFSCAETYRGIGNNAAAANQVYRPYYARYYVHAIRLVNSAGAEVPLTLADDGVWQLPSAGVVEIDGENGGTCAGASGNLKAVGTVPLGTYSGLKLTVGLPESINHLNANVQPPPLNQTDMFWVWTSGYRFLRIEGRDATGKSVLPGGLLHLGSTACETKDQPSDGGAPDLSKGATCRYANTIELSFDGFDHAVNKVVLDVGKLFQDTDLATNRGLPAQGCMSALSDVDCPAIFQKLGLPYGDGFQPDGGYSVVVPDAGQSVFTKE